MSGEDLLFYFMDGLQNWAKQELQRRQVKDVDEAIAVAESLTDFRTEAPSQGTPRANPSDLEEIVHIETKASKLLAPIVIPKEKATAILTGATGTMKRRRRMVHAMVAIFARTLAITTEIVLLWASSVP